MFVVKKGNLAWVAERSMAADCKSADGSLHRFESCPMQVRIFRDCPCSSVVERILGKDEVTGSIPVEGCAVCRNLQ